MRWSRFSRFDFDDPGNIHLYLKRRGAVFWILVLGVAFGGALWFIHGALDPDWNPRYVHGKGAGMVTLIWLMPVPVRAAVFVCFLAVLAEAFCRSIYRMYGRHAAFVIGPSGVARLDPWNPCALGWDEVQEIRREMNRNLWGRLTTTLELAFLSAPLAPPPYLPAWLWRRLPARLTGRRIDISPRALGCDERELIALVRQFAGPVAIVDHEYSVVS